jgi:hypothetical protein
LSAKTVRLLPVVEREVGLAQGAVQRVVVDFQQALVWDRCRNLASRAAAAGLGSWILLAPHLRLTGKTIQKVHVRMAL